MSTNEIQVEGAGQPAHEQVGAREVSGVGEAIHAGSREISGRIEETGREIRDMGSRAGTWLQRMDDAARENPGAAIVGAVLAGFVVGALIRATRPEPSPVRQYMGETRGWLASIFRPIFRPLGKGAQRAYKASTEAFRGHKREGFLSRIRD